MSPASTIPMHGRDHCQTGADPIPCMPGASPGSVTYSDYVTSFSSLIGYWRLGETGSPWEDTNPNGYGPNDMTLHGSGAALTPDVTGALTTDDDGAVEFNHDGNTTSGGEYLSPVATTLFTGLTDMTVAAFVKTDASLVSRRGDIVSIMVQDLSFADQGWALEIVYPARTVRFARKALYATSPGSLVAGDWYHVAGTFDGANIKLYLNGTLVATTADTIPSVGVGSEPPRIGGGYNVAASWLVGTVDEAAVWNEALTAAEIANLYSAGSEESGDAGSFVLVSDGAGGSTWGKVTSPAIEDGTITDADVSAAAGLAVTKLAEGTDGQVLTTVGGVTTWATPAIPDPADDPAVWMPLTTVVAGVPELVWDGNDNLIPTLTPI